MQVRARRGRACQRPTLRRSTSVRCAACRGVPANHRMPKQCEGRQGAQRGAGVRAVWRRMAGLVQWERGPAEPRPAVPHPAVGRRPGVILIGPGKVLDGAKAAPVRVESRHLGPGRVGEACGGMQAGTAVKKCGVRARMKRALRPPATWQQPADRRQSRQQGRRRSGRRPRTKAREGPRRPLGLAVGARLVSVGLRLCQPLEQVIVDACRGKREGWREGPRVRIKCGRGCCEGISRARSPASLNRGSEHRGSLDWRNPS